MNLVQIDTFPKIYMKQYSHRLPFFCLLCLLFATSACASHAPLHAQATPGSPASAVVEDLALPYDASKPRVAIMVDVTRCDTEIAAQLTTTLARVGNFVLYDTLPKPTTAPSRREAGPYIVRATVTEYNEAAESDAESSGFSFGWLGFMAAIAGAVTGEPGLMWSGVGVAAANPGYHESFSRTVGMVGLDVQIIDPQTGRILSSFSASGRFVSRNEEASVSILGIGTSSERSASSALGQARRIALNDVAQKTRAAILEAR